MERDNSGLWLALGALFLLSSRRSGCGTCPPTGPYTPAEIACGCGQGGGAPAVLAGAVGSVALAAGGVTKKPNDPIQISITWNADTKDSKGAFISWPYQLVLTPGYGGAPHGPITLPIAPSTGAGIITTYQTIAPATLGPYVVNVSLQAAKSDANGSPTSQYLEVATGVSQSIDIVAATAPAVPGGAILGVSLSQRRGRSMSGLRWLRLRQSRSPIDYDPSIGGILDPNAWGIGLAPQGGTPVQASRFPAPSLQWQLQSRGMTRPGDQPYGKVVGGIESSNQLIYKLGSGRGIVRPTYYGGVPLNSDGFGGTTMNGPGLRFPHGQNAGVPFYQPSRPRGATRGY